MPTRNVFTSLLLVCLQLAELQARTQSLQVSGIRKANLIPLTPSSSVILHSPKLQGFSNLENISPSRHHRGRLIASKLGKSEKTDHTNHQDLRPVAIDQIRRFKSVVFWSINQKETPISKDIDHLSELCSHDCYIGFQTSVGPIEYERPDPLNIYYWIGKNSSNELAAVTAATAMMNKNFYSKDTTVILHREAEGQESHAFKALFKEDQSESSTTIGNQAQMNNKKRIFVIEGDNSFKEVIHKEELKRLLSFGDFANDRKNCYVFVSEMVYASCGDEASVSYKFRAIELARCMMNRKDLVVEEVKMHRNDTFLEKITPDEERDLQQLFDELGPNSQEAPISQNTVDFTRREFRRILGQTVTKPNGHEWFNIKCTRIYIDADSEFQEEKITNNLLPLILEHWSQDCFLVDSQSNGGLFVWLGMNSLPDLHEKCAHIAELYLRQEEYNYGNFITYVGQEELPEKISTAQDMVSCMIAENEKNENQPTNDFSVESTMETEDNEINLPTQDDKGSSKNLVSKNQENMEETVEDELSRLRILFHPPHVDRSGQLELQRGGLNFDQLVELLQYSSRSYKADDICKLMNIQSSQIGIILEQLETLKRIIRNCATKAQIRKVFKKLSRFLQTQPQN